MYIPKEANMTIDDVLDVTVTDGEIKLSRSFRHKTLEERAAEYGDKLGLDGEYDFGEPVGREYW